MVVFFINLWNLSKISIFLAFSGSFAMKNDNVHIFFFVFFLFWLQIWIGRPCSKTKNTRLRLFPWKRSVLQNADRERTDQSAQIYLRLALPYNKTHIFKDCQGERYYVWREKKKRISGGVWVFNEVWGAREWLISPWKSRWRWCRTKAEILALDFAKSNLISFSMVGHSRYSQITSRCPENLGDSTFIARENYHFR